MGWVVQIICGAVLAVGLLSAAQVRNSSGEKSGGQGGVTQGGGTTRNQTTASPTPVQRDIEAAPSDTEIPENVAQAAESRRRAERDLRAQENMAFWAMWMFIAAGVSIVLSGAGVFLIWRTLLYTRTAAGHSATMVAEAQKTSAAALLATKAAQKQIEIAERTAELQLRAYLQVQQVNLSLGPDGTPTFDVICKNTGTTPCKYFDVGVQAYARQLETVAPAIPDDVTFHRWLSIGGGCEREARYYAVKQGIDLRLVDPTTYIWACGRVRWEDAFGSVQELAFRAFHVNHNLSAPAKMTFAIDAIA